MPEPGSRRGEKRGIHTSSFTTYLDLAVSGSDAALIDCTQASFYLATIYLFPWLQNNTGMGSNASNAAVQNTFSSL